MTTWAIEVSPNAKSSYKRSVTSNNWTLAWAIWTAVTARNGARYRFKRNDMVIARKK